MFNRGRTSNDNQPAFKNNPALNEDVKIVAQRQELGPDGKIQTVNINQFGQEVDPLTARGVTAREATIAAREAATPVAVKKALNEKGVLTTMGINKWGEVVPATDEQIRALEDAPFVERQQEAAAAPAGETKSAPTAEAAVNPANPAKTAESTLPPADNETLAQKLASVDLSVPPADFAGDLAGVPPAKQASVAEAAKPDTTAKPEVDSKGVSQPAPEEADKTPRLQFKIDGAAQQNREAPHPQMRTAEAANPAKGEQTGQENKEPKVETPEQALQRQIDAAVNKKIAEMFGSPEQLAQITAELAKLKAALEKQGIKPTNENTENVADNNLAKMFIQVLAMIAMVLAGTASTIKDSAN